MTKTLLIQTIQFNISTHFSSIWPINRILSGVTTPGQSWAGSDGNEGLLNHYRNLTIRLFCGITWTPFGEEVLPLCRDVVWVFYSPSWLVKNVTFPKGISNSFVQDVNSAHGVHFLWRWSLHHKITRCLCCILTFERAIYQGFLYTGCTRVNKWTQLTWADNQKND